MELTKKQERMLEGEDGQAVEYFMNLLVKLGDLFGADRMVPVRSVQVAGVSFSSIGEPGMEWLEDMVEMGARVKSLTYLNPAGMDLENWKEMGIPPDFAEKQLRIIDAYRNMGIVVTATCTPYLAGNLPRFREHIAWAESSAVSFSNSVLGARTNREGGPSALGAAVCGFTPHHGLHCWENRQPTKIINVETEMETDSDYGALGYFVGEDVSDGIPYFKGLKNPSTDNLKSLGAAMAASGAVALYHVEGMTPEADLVETRGLESVTVGRPELTDIYEKKNTGEEADILIFGCPHASLAEIAQLSDLVKGKTLKKPVWICASRMIKEAAIRMGYVDILEKAGGKVVADTCCVVSPIEKLGYSTTGMNSGKAAFYLPGKRKQKVLFNDMASLVSEVIQ